jgi:hypothetical protein
MFQGRYFTLSSPAIFCAARSDLFFSSAAMVLDQGIPKLLMTIVADRLTH